MKHSDNQKTLYWNHFIENKHFWGNGFTLKRLEKIKQIVWDDSLFWDDILIRHGAQYYKPESLQKHQENMYDHCMGNMTGMLMQLFVEHEIIKP